MNVKKELILREIMGENVLVPSGKTVYENNGLFMLTETAAFIWKILPDAKNEEEILKAVLSEYEIGEEEAKKDIDEFLSKLREMKIID
ncbi:MAG: PqqD family protein [Clostridia bacterium]|nr:PqqD family protein [Clostridia bacterium]